MKKILSIFTLCILTASLFFLTSCETFEETVERSPSGYKAITYDSDDSILKDICVDKTVFIICPGIKERPAISSLVSFYEDEDDYTIYMDSALKDGLLQKDDVKESLDSGEEVVLIVAPGVSSKGLGAAGIDVQSEIDRAKEICALKDDYDTLTIIQVNNEAYDADTDGKSVNLFKEIFPYIDCLIVSKERVNNVFRSPAVQYKFPVVEASLTEFQTIFDYMFGYEE